MIVFDYIIRSAPSPSADLRSVGESDLHYDLFLGDITFRVAGSDMSTSWGWVPVIDFATCLHRIAEEMQSNQTESFEFTESEHRIEFELQNGEVDIRATYGTGSAAKVSRDEFRSSTREFLRRVLDELTAKYPSLAENATIRRLYPMSAIWYEVWANEGLDVPYILILRPSETGFEILDPAEGNRRVFSSEKYDDARFWLGEDEFVFVARKELDDP